MAKFVADMRSDDREPAAEPQKYVIGPLGNRMTIDQLPPPETERWVVRRKAEVIAAIRGDLISRADACTRYRISEEELRLWERAIDCAGIPGLRVTRVQVYRPIFEGK
jgi:hypothetical protein